MIRKLIFNGGKIKEGDFDLGGIIETLKLRQVYMHNLMIEDLIDYFEELTKFWKTEKIYKKLGNLRNLTEYFSKDNLENNLRTALRGDYKVMDKLTDLGDKKLMFKVQPRGLTVHWLAGNVSILGIFSILSALITKNVCLVRASFRGYEELIDLLDALTLVKTKAINGQDLARSVAVVLVDKEDREIQETMSLAADLRVAWGGREAVETIMNMRKKWFCEDIVFGPKYSYAVIDAESRGQEAKSMARRLAIDISVFNQEACSSPHTVFIQGSREEAREFALLLARQLDFVNRVYLPKGEIDSAMAAAVISLRAEYELKGEVFNSTGTEWTVIFTEEEGLAQACFSRVIFVKSIDDLGSLADYNDRYKQTLGLGFTENNKLIYIDKITRKGVDRCPDLGYLTFYEPVWDGMFLFDRMVRWVTTHKG